MIYAFYRTLHNTIDFIYVKIEGGHDLNRITENV
jgi:hypothetical protein